MVSKSFLEVACACGERSPQIRRDVDDDLGWESKKLALDCEHFTVYYKAYTHNSYTPWGERDTVRFDLTGKCKNCKVDLEPSQSVAYSVSTPTHQGKMLCRTCKCYPGWVVDHRAHNALKVVGYTAVAVVVGGLVGTGVGAVGGAVLGTSVSGGATFGATGVALASGSVTMVQNVKNEGAGVAIVKSVEELKTSINEGKGQKVPEIKQMKAPNIISGGIPTCFRQNKGNCSGHWKGNPGKSPFEGCWACDKGSALLCFLSYMEVEPTKGNMKKYLDKEGNFDWSLAGMATCEMNDVSSYIESQRLVIARVKVMSSPHHYMRLLGYNKRSKEFDVFDPANAKNLICKNKDVREIYIRK